MPTVGLNGDPGQNTGQTPNYYLGSSGAKPPPPPPPQQAPPPMSTNQSPTIPSGTPGTGPAGAPTQPGGASRPFNTSDPTTWGQGAISQQDAWRNSNGQVPNLTSDLDSARTTWEGQQNMRKPWLTNAQADAETRNNYYYGGGPNGAADFNAQLGSASQGLGMNFAGDASGATRIGDQAQANGAWAGQTGYAAANRNPGQFLDATSMGNNAADRGAQLGAIGGLNAAAGGLNQYIANGPGPSAAQAQLNMATDANMGNSLALARSGRGLGQSQSALRQAIGQNAQTQQQSANQSAVLKAQEAQNWQQNQLSAYGQLGNAYGQIGNIGAAARQGDLGAASYYTGSQQNAQNANDQTGLGYSNLQQQYGNQQIAAGQLGLGAHTADANQQLGFYGLQNNVNTNALNASSNYENGQTNLYLGQLNPDRNKGTDYTPYIQAGAATLATLATL